MFLQNLFASSYYYYSNPKLNISPRFGATVIVLLIEILVAVLLLAIFKKFAYFIFFTSINKYFLLIIFCILACLNIYYFDKKRSTLIIKKFECKPKKYKEFWTVVTISLVIVPIVFIAFLLK